MVTSAAATDAANDEIVEPARRRHLVLILLAIIVAVLSVLRWGVYVALGRTMNLFESGTAIVGGQRMLSGEMPFTEYFAFYGPLSYLLPAALAGVTGAITTADFGYDVIVGTATVVVAYLLTAKLTGRPGWALLAPASILLLGSNTSHTLPALLSALLLSYAETSGRRGLLVGAGIFGGLGLLWVQDAGAWICMAVFATLVIGLLSRRIRSVLTVRGFLLYSVGVVLGLSPWIAYAALRGAVSAWIYWSFVFPLTGYTARNSTGYFVGLLQSALQEGGIRGLYIFVFWVFPFIAVFMLAALNLLCALKWACWPSAGRGRSPDAPVTLLILSIYAALQLRVLVASVDEAKLVDVSAPTAVASVVVLLTLWPRAGAVPLRGLTKVVAAIVAVWLLLWPAWFQVRYLALKIGTPPPVVAQGIGGLPIVGAGPASVSPDQLGQLVGQVRALSGPDDQILVLPTSPLIYALAGRNNPIRWEYLDPVYTTPEVDASIAATVRQGSIRLVVLGDNFFPGSDLRGADLAPQTYAAIDENYVPQLNIGGFTLHVRR